MVCVCVCVCGGGGGGGRGREGPDSNKETTNRNHTPHRNHIPIITTVRNLQFHTWVGHLPQDAG